MDARDQTSGIRRGESGLSLVEVMVSLFLMVALAGLVQSGMLTVHTANQRGEAQLGAERRARETLDRVCQDLRRSSLQPDPVTGNLRYDFSEMVNGRQVPSFQVVVGAEMLGNELARRWSSPVEIQVGDDGVVMRTEGSSEQMIGVGIESITYIANMNGFEVTVTARGDARRGVDAIVRSRNIRPEN